MRSNYESIEYSETRLVSWFGTPGGERASECLSGMARSRSLASRGAFITVGKHTLHNIPDHRCCKYFPIFLFRVRRQPNRSSPPTSLPKQSNNLHHTSSTMATFADESGMEVADDSMDVSKPSFPPVSAVDAMVSLGFGQLLNVVD